MCLISALFVVEFESIRLASITAAVHSEATVECIALNHWLAVWSSGQRRMQELRPVKECLNNCESHLNLSLAGNCYDNFYTVISL